MKRILIILPILLLAALAAATVQMQQNADLKLQAALSGNDTLETCIISFKQRANQDAQRISELEAKVSALATGQTAK